MPFTLSHPAAILPLHRWSHSRLPLTALVVGSITPDAPYFIALDFGGESHTLFGIVYLDWPVGFALWFLFEYLLKQPTLELLPTSLRARIPYRRTKITTRSLSYVSVALMLGALTHVIWDSFTHLHTPLVDRFRIFRMTILSIGEHALPLYKFLQYASSVGGLLILTYAALGWWRRSSWLNYSRPDPLPTSGRVSALAALLVASLLSGVFDYLLHPNVLLERRFFFFCIGGMSGLALAWCALAALIRWRK